jgi:hypothetical protein
MTSVYIIKNENTITTKDIIKLGMSSRNIPIWSDDRYSRMCSKDFDKHYPAMQSPFKYCVCGLCSFGELSSIGEFTYEQMQIIGVNNRNTKQRCELNMQVCSANDNLTAIIPIMHTGTQMLEKFCKHQSLRWLSDKNLRISAGYELKIQLYEMVLIFTNGEFPVMYGHRFDGLASQPLLLIDLNNVANYKVRITTRGTPLVPYFYTTQYEQVGNKRSGLRNYRILYQSINNYQEQFHQVNDLLIADNNESQEQNDENNIDEKLNQLRINEENIIKQQISQMDIETSDDEKIDVQDHEFVPSIVDQLSKDINLEDLEPDINTVYYRNIQRDIISHEIKAIDTPILTKLCNEQHDLVVEALLSILIQADREKTQITNLLKEYANKLGEPDKKRRKINERYGVPTNVHVDEIQRQQKLLNARLDVIQAERNFTQSRLALQQDYVQREHELTTILQEQQQEQAQQQQQTHTITQPMHVEAIQANDHQMQFILVGDDNTLINYKQKQHQQLLDEQRRLRQLHTQSVRNNFIKNQNTTVEPINQGNMSVQNVNERILGIDDDMTVTDTNVDHVNELSQTQKTIQQTSTEFNQPSMQHFVAIIGLNQQQHN